MIKAFLATVLVAFAIARGDEPAPNLSLHIVPIPIQSNRLLSMSMDDDGFIWVGGFHGCFHRYDPRTGKVDTIDLPHQPTASACICAGKKVYVLGQKYPKLTIYDRSTKKLSEIAYATEKPNIYYGTPSIDGRFIYLFDRGSGGVIKWDTQTDTGKPIHWPYEASFPSSGILEVQDNAIWCRVMDLTKGKYQYVQSGIARLDLGKDEFAGWYPFPNDDTGMKPFTDPATTLFLPYTLKGKLVPFDIKDRRWCQFIPVPRYGTLFAFIGGQVQHKGRCYFALSTYNGTEVGCDGKSYHFCDSILEFDPRTRHFEFPTMEESNSYHQIAYMLSANGEFFSTGSNIREPDGTLNHSRRGEAVFWQTMRSTSK